MNDALTTAVIAASLLVALWSGALAALDRRVGRPLLALVGVLELLLVAQAVVAVVRLLQTGRPDSAATFIAYAVGVAVVPPVATAWSLAERSRASTLVITVGCLAVAVMVARMLQLWQASGA